MSARDRRLINLASAKLGAQVVYATDDFFADKSRLIADPEPVFIADKYDDHGKWMDGWESRRRRDDGHDWCVIRLACAGLIEEVELDTRHFVGNHPPAASLDACLCDDEVPGDDAEWTEMLAATPLKGDDRRRLPVAARGAASHLRLNVYPDGGMARLRVYGRPRIDWTNVPEDASLDLAASLNGGVAVACNNEHFGSMHNLLGPGRGVNMGDGWETRRRREPGHDWMIVKLGHPGVIRAIEIDTAHFKGNFPDRCFVQGAFVADDARDSVEAMSQHWPEMLGVQKLHADRVHRFEEEILEHRKVNHVRLNIVPDGGVSRLRLYGNVVRD